VSVSESLHPTEALNAGVGFYQGTARPAAGCDAASGRNDTRHFKL